MIDSELMVVIDGCGTRFQLDPLKEETNTGIEMDDCRFNKNGLEVDEDEMEAWYSEI